jgi:nucleoside-diphosphate-sugar epimerase
MNVLITGANGFIGSKLMKYLSAKKQYRVTGLVRESSNLFRLQGKSFDLLHGSLERPLETIAGGFDTVIHTAGLVRDWGHYDDFYRVNVEGSLNMIRASIKTGVRRFIHLSSTAVYGFGGKRDTAEIEKKKPFRNFYCITKSIAEDRLLEHVDKIELLILRPSNVFGPFDTTTTLPLLRGIEKGLFGFPKGGKTLTSPCFVENLVCATEICLITDEGIGEIFNITDGADIPWISFLQMMAAELSVKSPARSVPTLPLKWASVILERVYKLLHSEKPPPLTPYRIEQVARDYSFSIEKAKTVLHYIPPYTTGAGVRESVQWFKDLYKGGEELSTPFPKSP